MEKIKKANLPILKISEVIKKVNDDDLKEILLIAKILNGNRSYYWNRGKYGVITDDETKMTYRISQEAFERMQKIIDNL